MKSLRETIQIICMILVLALIAGCSGQVKVKSGWRNQDIAIDGQQQEWHAGLTYIESKNVSIGFFNDADYLYISLTTADRSFRRQFMAQGFMLWLDAGGGKEKKFGIRYPIGMLESAMPLRRPGREMESETVQIEFEKSLGEIELVLPNEEKPLRIAVSEAGGIEVKVGIDPDRLVYELKVPLRGEDKHPFAIEMDAAKETVGVGFETVKVEFGELRKRARDMGRPPVGRGGRGGGRGGLGGGRGGRSGGGFERPEQFKLWAKVSLGSEGEDTTAWLQPDSVFVKSDE